MATTITKSNLFSEARNNIVDIISANVNDPISSSAQYRKWIYSREPDVKSSNFKGYPFIIVHPAELSIGRTAKSLDRRSKMPQWTIEVEVVTSDRGTSSSTKDKGLNHMDTVCNSIVEELQDVTNLDTLRENLIHNVDIDASSVDTEPLSDELVYRRAFIISFETKIKTSS